MEGEGSKGGELPPLSEVIEIWVLTQPEPPVESKPWGEVHYGRGYKLGGKFLCQIDLKGWGYRFLGGGCTKLGGGGMVKVTLSLHMILLPAATIFP